MINHVIQAYPCRLYMGGLVITGDLHATNSVVVDSAEAEEDARAKGYRKAYEVEESISGNGGSESHPSPVLPDDQGGDATASADPIEVETKAYADGTEATGAAPLPDESPAEQLESLRTQAKALGLKPHHKAGADKLREMIAAAKS